MILDAIIGLFALVFGLIAGAVSVVCVPLINLIALCIELVVGVFVSGYSLGRLERKKAGSKLNSPLLSGLIPLLVILVLIGAFFVGPKILNRNIVLIATDGHSLPFASVVIHTENGDERTRTDDSGSVSIPRFRTTALTVVDPRYVEQKWEGSEIQSQLVVSRTTLGSGLDVLAGKLLEAAEK